MPDPASSPVNVTPTGWLNQPAASAGLAVTRSLTVGAVASYGICTAPEPVFPALSLHEPDAEPMPSGPEYVTPPEQPASPDACPSRRRRRRPAGCTSRSSPGSRSGDPPTLGPVESYLIVAPPLAGLPATSVQLPGTDAEPPSGPEYVTADSPRRPERLSVAVKLTATGWLYQPFASGARPRLEPVIAGPVSSYLNAELAALRCCPALSLHVIVPVADAAVGTRVRSARASRETRSRGSDRSRPPLKATGALYQPAWSGCPRRGSAGDRRRNRVDANIDRLLVRAFAVRRRARERRRPCCVTGNEFAPTWKQFPPGDRSGGHGERHGDRET